jgi:hypothetical protein
VFKLLRVLALVLVLGLAVAACGGGGGGFSKEARTEFMSGCEPEAGKAFCECVLDSLEETMTQAEFERMGVDAFASDDVPEEVMVAVFGCIDEIEIGG